uniref:Small ribosomal subunit protein uS14m n=1 Tax=Chaetosphaeridium globosum TaxID=96477 RepID=Q8M1G3_CHAGL|nr:ribosomal protein S14 [Chaetosphaeridium globosum]AAM96622.1 ribosomal protein S14 [Chaetosphaeridium globosum]
MKIERDKKRRSQVLKYELKRKIYKAIWKDQNVPSNVRYAFFEKLNKLPRNSSSVRVRNRCIFTGRARSVYSTYRMSRIVFRNLASKGLLIGIKKYSW